MNIPSTIFDSHLAERLASEGKNLAADNRRELLRAAQAIAFALAGGGRTISMDTVAMEMVLRGHDPAQLGNAAGRVFDSPAWEATGFVKSCRASTHARAIRTWILQP